MICFEPVMAEEGKAVFSAIPVIDPERMASLREQMLKFLVTTGAPPDYAVQAMKIEQALGMSRDEMRAVHMKILTEGLVAERARMGHIGLSERGQFVAGQLINPPPPDED
jgi:hypothetical protein